MGHKKDIMSLFGFECDTCGEKHCSCSLEKRTLTKTFIFRYIDIYYKDWTKKEIKIHEKQVQAKCYTDARKGLEQLINFKKEDLLILDHKVK